MLQSLLAVSLLGLTPFINAVPVATPLKARDSSSKRGLAFNEGALTKLFNPAQAKVSWMYNWASSTTGAQAGYEYIPMLHSDSDMYTATWEADVAAAVKAGATHIMSFNEPDQCGGGGVCMQDVGVTVAAHKKWVQPMADKYPNVKVGAPAVTNGVKDPNTGMAMGIPYLTSFLAGCSDCRLDYVAAHWYGDANNVDDFKSHLHAVHTAAPGKNVWVTEFAATGDSEGFLKIVMPWMDSQDWITHYAYQYVTPGVLVNDAQNGLTALGDAYASS